MNYWSLLFLFLLFACNLNSDASTTTSFPNIASAVEAPPTRRQLYRKQYELKDIHIITPSGKSSYTELWESMSGEVGRGMNTKYSTADQWEARSIASKVVFLVGTIADHELIQELSQKIPYTFENHILNFADKEYKDPSTIFRISLFPNPMNPNIPMYLLTGDSDKEIIKFIQNQYQRDWYKFIRSSFGYQVYEKSKCQLAGFFSEDSWLVDKKLHWDFSGQKGENYQTPHFEFIDHSNHSPENATSPMNIEQIGKMCEASCKAIEDFFGKKTSAKLQFHMYENMERKGLMTYNTSQSHLELQNNEIHVTFSEAYLDNNPQIENQFFLNDILGEAAQAWLTNGTSIFFAKKWQRFGFRHWAKKLIASENLPSLEELTNKEMNGFESPIVLGAGQAAFVDYILSIWGKEKFALKYNNWKPKGKELRALQKDFENHVKTYQLVNIPKRKKRQAYLQGFNFAHEGYQIYNGYGSTLSNRSLEAMIDLGSNAMALVPYSYMRDPNKPTSIPIVDHPGSETDESLVHNIQHAKQLGITTIMKPQLWLGKSWTGFIDMKGQADWDLFFENYYRWIRHFAILSEIYEVEIFSVGVEFVQATLQNEAAWVEMFEKLRPLFSGEMTYCANWGDEFEKLSFWEPLDFIGINCYYPLSDKDQPSQKELIQNFATISDKIEKISKKFDKKVVFTEIGFRSVEGTWKNPHAQADGRPVDVEAQAMSYEAVFQNIANKDWCDGILWWKWPSYLEYSAVENTRFTPLDKATEKVIKKWFHRE